MAPTMAQEIAEPDVLAPSAALDSPFPSLLAPSHETIAQLAYSIWEARGGVGGSPEEDWLAAEAALSGR
jgi:hypothetical protein